MCITGGMENNATAVEHIVPSKHEPRDPAIPLQGAYPEEVKPEPGTCLQHTHVHSSYSHSNQKGEADHVRR